MDFFGAYVKSNQKSKNLLTVLIPFQVFICSCSVPRPIAPEHMELMVSCRTGSYKSKCPTCQKLTDVIHSPDKAMLLFITCFALVASALGESHAFIHSITGHFAEVVKLKKFDGAHL